MTKALGSLSHWFARLGESDLRLRQIDEIRRDVAQWPNSCLKIITKLLSMSCVVPIGWAMTIYAFIFGSIVGEVLGTLALIASAVYTLWVITIFKNYLHELVGVRLRKAICEGTDGFYSETEGDMFSREG